MEIHVFAGTMISEFFFKLRDLTAISKASVPFPTVVQYFEPVNFEKFFSKFATSSPPTNLEFFIKELIFTKISFFFGTSLYKLVNLTSFYINLLDENHLHL